MEKFKNDEMIEVLNKKSFYKIPIGFQLITYVYNNSKRKESIIFLEESLFHQTKGYRVGLYRKPISPILKKNLL